MHTQQQKKNKHKVYVKLGTMKDQLSTIINIRIRIFSLKDFYNEEVIK